MNDGVKLILTKLKIVSEEKENGAYICDKEHSKLLLSYIKQLEKELKEEQEDNYKQSQLLVEKQKMIEQLEADYKEANESVTWWQNRYNALERENKNLKNNRDKAIEFINSEEFNTLTINKRKKLNDLLKGDSDD